MILVYRIVDVVSGSQALGFMQIIKWDITATLLPNIQNHVTADKIEQAYVPTKQGEAFSSKEHL